MSVQTVVAPDAQGAADACARRIFELLAAALSSRPRASLAVSGGSTPKLLFQKMAATPFEWDRVHLFFVDERCVPPTDSASNYKLANDHLIAPAHIPAGNVHRVAGEIAPPEAAAGATPAKFAISSICATARCRHSTSCIAAWAPTPTRRACFQATR